MKILKFLRDLSGLSAAYATGSWVTLWANSLEYRPFIWLWAVPSVVGYFVFGAWHDLKSRSEA